MQKLDCDLLIVGGTDSATPAATQAARLGVARIILVNDIDWFGGQWSCGGLSMIDEFAMYRGRWAPYPRSGAHLELIRFVRDYNRETFGNASPGNARAYQGSTPTGTATAFERLVEPYTETGTGQVVILRRYRPRSVLKQGNRVTGVVFESVEDNTKTIEVSAKLTVDASDWGDVIRRSGANYFTGADPKSRFGEEGAPEVLDELRRAEVNAINWCPVMVEAGRDATIERPANYDERLYYNSTPLTAAEFDDLGFPKFVARGRALPFNETVPLGGYTVPGIDNIYTHRRLVDRRHNKLKTNKDVTVIVRPPQDYPLSNFPAPLADALEALEPGASKKTIPEMTYEQRELVFEDAKQYYLGFVHFLQTVTHERMGDYPESFKYMELSDEFGTPDKLPPKPYIREGLRLDAIYNVSRPDYESGVIWQGKGGGRNFSPGFYDGVFCWQSWFDYHATRRIFLNDDSSQPWATAFKEGFRSTEANRGNFPLRGLVPAEVDGLIGSFINIGQSSIVCSGLRWHCTMPAVGQAAATLAAIALRHGIEPRDVAVKGKLIREVQQNLVTPPGGYPGVALLAYQDLPPDVDSDRLFEAANMLAVRGILNPRRDTLDFAPCDVVTRRELAGVVARAYASLERGKPLRQADAPLFTDVAADDPDRLAIESLAQWLQLSNETQFRPDEPTNWTTLHDWLTRLDIPPLDGLVVKNPRMDGELVDLGKNELWRWDMAVHVWAAIRNFPERFEFEEKATARCYAERIA